MSKKHILVLGATGLCGQLLIKESLNQGHKLTLYVRNPSKLTKETLDNDQVNVIEGEFDNLDGLKEAANCGADVFICVAGPTLGKRNGKVSNSLISLDINRKINKLAYNYSLASFIRVHTSSWDIQTNSHLVHGILFCAGR